MSLQIKGAKESKEEHIAGECPFWHNQIPQPAYDNATDAGAHRQVKVRQG